MLEERKHEGKVFKEQKMEERAKLPETGFGKEAVNVKKLNWSIGTSVYLREKKMNERSPERSPN